ncbi:hypothetical protein OAD03_02955, partial [Candidatus Pelagibacter sp.]|nr:hypothetical protein [Candidatus Pelagibacter sp.]MDB9930771.1 hypothetical protein [Candidatus Pelagibacter sp.]
TSDYSTPRYPIYDLVEFIMVRLDEIIEPIYFLITSITFILLSIIQYKKFGKTRETKYLAGLSIFFLCSYIVIILKN